MRPSNGRPRYLRSFRLDKQVEMVSGAGRERMSKLLEAMSPDDRVDLLRQLDPEVVEGLMPLVAKAERQDIRTLLSYPEEKRRLGDDDRVRVASADATVGEAIERSRQQAPTKETIYYIYVLDENRHLLGFVSLARPDPRQARREVADIMQRDVISVRVDEDQEEVVKLLARYDFLAIPVVDDQHRLVGIITHDDVIDVMSRRGHRRRAAHGRRRRRWPRTTWRRRSCTIWRKRAVWLSCLFVAELFTFTALARLRRRHRQACSPGLFVPLCISTGGNSGSQAATLITRAHGPGPDVRQVSGGGSCGTKS